MNPETTDSDFDELHDRPIRVTILDTETGKTAEVGLDYSAYWWAEGNGSCDCNRQIVMQGFYTDDVKCGNLRYLIISADTDCYSLRELNDEYPEELVAKYVGAK